jgi:hypothetical protein
MKNRAQLLGAAVILGCAPSTLAAAEVTASEALAKIKANDRDIYMYIAGLKSGFDWANGVLLGTDKPLLYCQPGKMVLTIDQSVNVVEQFVNRHPDFKDHALGFALVQGLIETFPCKAPKP